MKNYNAWQERGNSTTPEAVFAQSLSEEEKLNFLNSFWGRDYTKANPENYGGYIGNLNNLVVQALNKMKG